MPEQDSGDQTQTRRKPARPKWFPTHVEHVVFWDHTSPSNMEWADVAEDLDPAVVVGVGFIRRETDLILELISYKCEPNEDESQDGTGKFTIIKSCIIERHTIPLKGRRGKASS